MDFTGKVVLVTGGTRGIGKALCQAFLERNAIVYTCARKEDGLRAVEAEFASFKERFHALQCHVAQPDKVDYLMGRIRDERGKLDILVNNVGMNIFTPSTVETDISLWDKIIETNLKGPFVVTNKAFELLKQANGAKIINISSMAGRKAAPGMGVYCVAKAGLDMLTKVLAAELAPYNITVNGIAPGVVRTDFSRPLWEDKEILKEIVAQIPLGRIAEIRDVVGAVLFLASDLADYINGETILLDGGACTK